jgi:deazaflavin-dependent oxidoreductase (nitroreductase family)
MRTDEQIRPVQLWIRRIAATRGLAWLSARILHRIDALVFRATRGRTTFSTWISGMPIVMLTTTGAKTGKQRTLPLVALPDGDELIVIASNFGRRNHPAWYYNLRAHPRVVVAVNGVRRHVEAHELSGEERDWWYQRGIDINPGWVQYRQRAAHRLIPVIRLVPLA